jgi:ABC-type amino acid transport substrate-binding protein
MPYEMLFITLGGGPLDLETARGLKTVLVHQDAPPYLFLVEKGFKNLYTLPFGAGPLMNMLLAGRGDAWFSDRHFARYAVRGTQHEGQLTFGPPVVEEHLYIAWSRSNSPEVVSAYRSVFDEIRPEGIVDKIMVKYLGKPD